MRFLFALIKCNFKQLLLLFLVNVYKKGSYGMNCATLSLRGISIIFLV